MKYDLILLDASALIYRAFYAVPDRFKTSKGEVTNAIYGFSNILIHVLKHFAPEYIVVAYDLRGKTFRHEAYEEYKATRIKAPDELHQQIPRTKDLLDACNIIHLEKQGFEADDVIGSLTTKFARDFPDKHALIISGDQDLYQLVNDRIHVSSLQKGVSKMTILDAEGVFEKLHVMPSQVVDYKALTGDSSDNIPGIPGVGPKTATGWLQSHKTLEGIYEHIYELSPRFQTLLQDNKDLAIMSKDLATIETGLEFNTDWEAMRWRGITGDAVRKLCAELEFTTILPKIMQLTPEYMEQELMLEEIQNAQVLPPEPPVPSLDQQSLF